MAFLGRPSSGDSPFAIGDKAMRDTTSPQPPSQRNPTPRRAPGQIDQDGHMTTPSPYGTVSDEGRRRYEERYARKKAEEEGKAGAERQQQMGPPQGSMGPPQGSMGPPQQPCGPPQHPQHLQPGSGPQRLPINQQSQSRSPQPQSQQRSPQPQQFSPQSHSQSLSDPRQSYPAQSGQQSQSYPNRDPYGNRPPSLPRPPSGYTPPPPQQMQFQQQQEQQPQPPAPSGQQQRYSNPPNSGGRAPQWSSKAVPPPSQQWQQGQSSPPQPTEDGELHALFAQFDSSRSGQLNSYDLQRLLAKDATMEAREDAVKMLMNIFDTDRSGSINFMEFEGLYRYIQDWHGIFLRFDRDSSGLIDRKELHQALLGFGFSLPSDMVRKLEKRFAPPPKPGHQRPEKGISFDRFLMACVTVKHFTEAFRRADSRGEGRLTLDYNQFMEMVLEGPA